MGMFDTVEFIGECRRCQTEITDWQSKDADCMLDMINPVEVNEFYGTCPKCQAMTYYDVKKKCVVDTIIQRKELDG